MWTLKPGIEHRFHQFLKRDASKNAATLRVENGWYVANRLIVRETVDLKAPRSSGDKREIELAIALEATASDVVIAGSPEDAKGYAACACASVRKKRILTPEARWHRTE